MQVYMLHVNLWLCYTQAGYILQIIKLLMCTKSCKGEWVCTKNIQHMYIQTLAGCTFCDLGTAAHIQHIQNQTP